jgi:hypothetical protein
VVGIACLGYVLVGEFPVGAIYHPAHPAGVDEKHLAAAVTKALNPVIIKVCQTTF